MEIMAAIQINSARGAIPQQRGKFLSILEKVLPPSNVMNTIFTLNYFQVK